MNPAENEGTCHGLRPVKKLMRTMRMKYWDQLAECLESEDFEKTENVLSQIEKEEIPIGYVDRIFRFMEEHPDTDYGEPGPIVHFLERQIPSLYEAMLLKSVTNKPTCHTLWMLNRVINSYGAADSESFMQALQEAAVRTDIPEDVRKEAATFLKFQGAELDRRAAKKPASGQTAFGSAVPQASGQVASGIAAPQPAGIAAELNRLDKFKRSLLQKAIAEGKWDVAEDLIAQGIDVNNQDSYGSTALHELCRKADNVELIEQVLKAGGNPNLRDLDDMSPLYMAVDRDCGECGEKYKIIELLLKYGADKDLLCANGTTPAERAEQTGDEVAAELLARYPSNPVEKNYPKDANELYAFAHGQFRKHSYVVAVEAILTLPQEEITSDMAGTLIASYNNMGRYDDALAACERLQHLYRNKMRVWYYFTSYAYVGKKDCEKADESIAAGIAECDRERAAGIISERFYKSEIADFRDFEKQVKAIWAAAVGGPNRFSQFLEDMDSEALENAPEQELARLESLFCGKAPRMLMDAFREHVPVREIEGEDIIFYGIDRITEENTEAVPGANLYKLGLYTFASTADGDSICFDSRDPAFPVYQCSHSLLEDAEEISFYKDGEMKHLLFNDKTVRKVSGRVADSFEEFVEDLHNGEADLYSIEEMLAEV